LLRQKLNRVGLDLSCECQEDLTASDSFFGRRVHRDVGDWDTDKSVCITYSYPRPPTHIYTFHGDDWMLSDREV